MIVHFMSINAILSKNRYNDIKYIIFREAVYGAF